MACNCNCAINCKEIPCVHIGEYTHQIASQPNSFSKLSISLPTSKHHTTLCNMPHAAEGVSLSHGNSSSLSPSFTIPPHLMGRNVQNPTSDTTSPGRRLQKPRPGVRVPYRNLTSQIVTQEEIAQEILQRSIKRNSGSQSSSPVVDHGKCEVMHHGASGDSIFAMRLSRRLANQLSSSQTNSEGKSTEGCLGNPGDLWAQVQAEPSDQNHLSNQGCSATIDRRLAAEIHGDPNGDEAAVMSHSVSPKLNRHTKKLDRDAEREMALKQLSELPMIKGGTRELSAESVPYTCKKRTLRNSDDCIQLTLHVLNPSDLKHFDKQDVKKCNGSDLKNCSVQVVLEKPAMLLDKSKLENLSSSNQSEDKLVLSHDESKLISQRTKTKCADTKNGRKITENIPQYKFMASDGSFPKDSNLRSDKTLKSSVSNGHCSSLNKEIGKKRRSARLNTEEISAEPKIDKMSSQLSSEVKLNPSKIEAHKKKGGRPRKRKNNRFLCTVNPDTPTILETASITPLTGEPSPKKILVCHSSLNDPVIGPSSTPNHCSSQSSVVSKTEHCSALKSPIDSKVSCSSGEMKENKIYEDEQESLSCNSKELKKTTYVKGLNELNKLFIDEGAINMLLEASPLKKEMPKQKKSMISRKRELRKIAKQNILYKTNLVRKSVLLNSTLSSRPKRKINNEKLKKEVDLPKVQLTGSPGTSVQRILFPVAAKSRIFRRHSSSSSFSSRSGSPVRTANDQSRKSNCNNNRDSKEETSSSVFKIVDSKMPTVDLERLTVAQMRNTLDQHSVIKFSSPRKVVAVPRMSAAVRMKLNTEMSKNFQKGLEAENTKNISPKSLKAKKSQFPSEVSLKVTTEVDQIKSKPLEKSTTVDNTCSKQSTIGILNPKNIQALELLNGQELAVCVKKLQERKDVSITTINDSNDSKDRFSNSNLNPVKTGLTAITYPETVNTARVVPKQLSSVKTAELVPKLKKFKNSKTSVLKQFIDKEHRIVGVPLSPIAARYSSIMKSLENVSQKHKKKTASKLERQMESKEFLRQRSSGRQNAGTYNYKEICIRRYENFVQIILTPGSTKMKNSLNVQVLHEFRDALQQLRRDEFCRVVLVTSTGSSFCQGVDLHTLLHTNTERRKKAAVELSQALKEFLKVLAMFNKPIVAGVHGATVGLGVTMLPFFDVVYASDKATFHAPYARLGQVPEGAAVLTLPLMLGNAVTSELLFGSRRLTASEAHQYGLVTRVLWPDRFQEELIPNVKAIASQSSQSMESMKALLRLNLRVKLEATLESESGLLVQHWCSPECQRNFRKFLETSDDVFLQRQKKDPC